MINNLIIRIYKYSIEKNFSTNVLGLVRSIIALSTLFTLIFNSNEILFHIGAGASKVPFCDGFLSSINIFCIFSSNLNVAKLLCIFILLLVVSGYYPRYTGLLHWWVAFSIYSGLLVGDGGEQVSSVITFLLIPLTLLDSRKNHWLKSKKVDSDYKMIFSAINIYVIKIQIAFIYFDAAISKLYVSEWQDGTALFYFFNEPMIGSVGLRKEFFNFIFDFPILLVTSTYSIMAFELLLFLSLFIANKSLNKVLFSLGILFHLFIFLIFGIFTFALTMCACLILLLMPIEKNINLVSKFYLNKISNIKLKHA